MLRWVALLLTGTQVYFRLLLSIQSEGSAAARQLESLGRLILRADSYNGEIVGESRSAA